MSTAATTGTLSIAGASDDQWPVWMPTRLSASAGPGNRMVCCLAASCQYSLVRTRYPTAAHATAGADGLAPKIHSTCLGGKSITTCLAGQGWRGTLHSGQIRICHCAELSDWHCPGKPGQCEKNDLPPFYHRTDCRCNAGAGQASVHMACGGGGVS